MPDGADDDAQRALAAGLDVSAGRLAEDGDVGAQPVGQFAFDAAQTVCGGFDFLAVVHHQRDVVLRFGDRRGQMQEHRVARFHVRGATAVQYTVGQAAGHVVGGRNGVDVAGQQHARRPAQVGARQHGVGVADDLEPVGLTTQGGFDLVGDALLAARLAGDVHQRRGQGDRVAVQVKAHPPDVSLSSVTSAAGIGLATLAADGTVLDTWFPAPELGADGASGTVRLSVAEIPEELGVLTGPDEDRGVEIVAVRTTISSLDDKATDAYDAYLRLHLLSHRLVAPHGLNADGFFGLLTNVVWTNHGPCAVEGFEIVRARLRRRSPVTVYGVDKFPRMVDYVLPSGVRVADADRVRLGAHLAAGTTVMHEGFVNFNAGTLGNSMVEGRISAGVVVDDGSDVGGGASIMGTLSGGGTEVISVGKRCLLGANAGLGISLGDDCVVEAGLYVTAGTKVPDLRRSDGQGSRALGGE